MNEVNNSNKPSWFVNPWFDIILLTGFPIVLLLTYLLNYLSLYFSTTFLVIWYWFAIFTSLHFFATLSIVYLDRQKGERNLTLFLWVPLSIVIATIFFFILGYSNLVATILFYGVVWHILAQNYHILQLHKLRNQDCLRLDNTIDNITIIIGPIYFLLKSLSYLKLIYTGGIVYTISINLHLLNYLRILTWISIAAFIARQIYLFIRWERINIFKISMISMTILSFYYSLVLIKNTPIFIMCVFRWHHNIQSLLWAWFYHRKKFIGGIIKEARLISYLSQPGRAGLYILFFMLANSVFTLVMKGISFLTINPGFSIPVIYSAMLFLHIFLDGFIWRISKVHSIVNT